MTRRELLAVGVASLIGTKVVAQSRTSGSKVYPYLTYLPENYEKGKKYPLVIYLHGSSHRGTDLQVVKRGGLARLAEDGLPLTFILIVPQCPSGKIWSTEDWFGTLLSDVQKQHAIDAERIYITGVSMGGGGAFDVAKMYPNTFAAVVPLCAWASSANGLCTIKHVPIWTFHGTLDDVVPISQTEEKVNVLNTCKGNIKYTRLEGKGHNIHDVYDPKNEFKVISWMLQHKRSKSQ